MPNSDPNSCKVSAVEEAQSSRGTEDQMISQKTGALLLVACAYGLGGGGLLAWMSFLVIGPRLNVDLQLSVATGLLVDALLCLLFFIQHSVMVRRRFRVWLTRIVRSDFHGALYASVSGGCLLLLILFWQPVGSALWTPPTPVRWFLGGLIVAALSVGWWGSRAL